MKPVNYRVGVKFLMKAGSRTKTPLTAAYPATATPARKVLDQAVRTVRLRAHSSPCPRGDLPSFPPCLIPPVDGIFRPGGGGPGRVPRRPGENLPVRKIVAARERPGEVG